ncbi:hypothetical protein BIW11_09762 [Tropilaelaps mercedesae]|uniref:LNR domain-containing protein n=1 Tax=Tropilaelaps mercedesae TaxID=418985 RepID=A0A1V9XIT2_9ACAR|nr:hypothetical protein BIW11_09762 [Tropilaelaps mercedesae]
MYFSALTACAEGLSRQQGCTHYTALHRKSQNGINGTPEIANGTAVIPPCGETPCDNSATTLSYLLPENRHLTQLKVLKYRVVNIANDDGSNPVVKLEQVQRQNEMLVKAFAPYNISFDLDHVILKNTRLRQTGILFGCNPANIGDGICQAECVLYSTFNDGGDCDPKDAVCSTDMIHDGVCQQVCNDAEHDYDGGDCCVMSPDNEPLCLDPVSPNRRQYMTIEDFKDYVKLDNQDRLNIMFAEWTNSYLIGLATFPWDSENAMSVRGGIVMKPREYGVPGHTATLVHEMGHILGLWHVHHGISEMACGDFCYEWSASMTTGDLCSDTPPSPVHMLCSNPRPRSDCGRLQVFSHAPISNYMSYSGDDCMDHFSPQQMARMHCHINRFYNEWRVDNGTRHTLHLYVVSNAGRVVLHWESVANMRGSEKDGNQLFLVKKRVVSYATNNKDTTKGEIRRRVRGTVFADHSVQVGEKITYTVTRISSMEPLVKGKVTVEVN